jgi:hypothetical protein
LPWKRFATAYLVAQAEKYLSPKSPPETYRSIVRHERLNIGYPVLHVSRDDSQLQRNSPTKQDVDQQQAIDHDLPLPQDLAEELADGVDPHHQPVIPASLPWRFIGWLGTLTLALTKAREMLLQKNPDSLCHRVAGSVDPFKARSEQRMVTLETARQLLLIIPEWEACFDRPFFSQFATRAGFD